MKRIGIAAAISASFALAMLGSAFVLPRAPLYGDLPEEVVALYFARVPTKAEALTRSLDETFSIPTAALDTFLETGKGERALVILQKPWRIAFLADGRSAKNRAAFARWALKHEIKRAPISGARIVFAESKSAIQSIKHGGGRRRLVHPSAKSMLSSLEEAVIIFPPNELGQIGRIVSKDNALVMSFSVGSESSASLLEPKNSDLFFWQGDARLFLGLLSTISAVSVPGITDGLTIRPELDGTMAVRFDKHELELAWRPALPEALPLAQAALSEFGGILAAVLSPELSGQTLPDKTLFQELRADIIEPNYGATDGESTAYFRKNLDNSDINGADESVFSGCKQKNGQVITLLNLESSPHFLGLLRDNLLYLCIVYGG